MIAYTNKLKLKHSDLGAVDWKDEEDGNRKAIDSAIGSLLTVNRVISGCEVINSGGLTVDVAAGLVRINGVLLAVSGVTLALTAGEGAGEQQNWVYVNDSGIAQDGPVPPTGTFVLLAIVDTSDADVLRIADVRPFGSDFFVRQSTVYHIATTGDDVTGDGSATSPVYSINAAMALLQNKRILPGVTVTLSVADGTYEYSTTQAIDHPDGKSIELIGNETTPANVSIETTAGDSSVPTLNLDTVTVGKIAGLTITKDDAWCILLRNAHIGRLSDLALDDFCADERSAVDRMIDCTCSSSFWVKGSSFVNLRSSVVGNIDVESATLLLWLVEITGTGDYLLDITKQGIVRNVTGLEFSGSTIGVAIRSSAGGCFYTPASGSTYVDTGAATTPYSPALTTGETPTYGNNLGLNYEGSS